MKEARCKTIVSPTVTCHSYEMFRKEKLLQRQKAESWLPGAGMGTRGFFEAWKCFKIGVWWWLQNSVNLLKLIKL